jgi:hypothetical protein
MNRKQRSDPAFGELCEQRDHIAIQVSLAWDAQPADLVRLAELQRNLRACDLQIYNYRPTDASDAIAVDGWQAR